MFGLFKKNPDNYGISKIPHKIPMPECKPPKVDYDYKKNIKRLIERYQNKIVLLSHGMYDYEFNSGVSIEDGLAMAIHDLEDMLDEMEV